MKDNRFYSIVAIALAAVTLGIVVQPARVEPICGESRLRGAIFTTLEDGSRVNANVYEAKEHVYLDGGPGSKAPPGAAGLAPGDYYFQVTDPSGKELLSEDSVECRRFTVSPDGVIVSVGECGHATGIDVDHAELGAITVQLVPYEDTPDAGGVYKVWVTLADCYSPGTGEHGFVPGDSMRTSFRVGAEVEDKGKPPLYAYDPSPPDGATGQPLEMVLSWQPGKNAREHEVFFGTDEADVSAGDPSTFAGVVLVPYLVLDPLDAGTTHYWRVDEISPSGTTPGLVWFFATGGP